MEGYFVLTFLIIWLKTTASEHCALIKGYNQYAYQYSKSSYVQLPGLFDVGEFFDVSFDVFPSPLSTAGAMFSLGSIPNFTYYDPLDRSLRYVVIEFAHDSLSLVVKSRNKFHGEVPLSKTYPEPYVIQDKSWHHIHVWRDSLGIEDQWNVAIDDVTPASKEVVRGVTDTIIRGKEAFIGGRPEYTTFQFQGIIKNVRLNYLNIPLKHAHRNGLTDVRRCNSRATKDFMNQLLEDYRYWKPRGPFIPYGPINKK